MAKNKNIIGAVLGLIICLCAFGQTSVRDQLEYTYLQEIGTREATGKNDGVKVETYLKTCKLTAGSAWCAAFVNWCYLQHCLPRPNSGWSPAWFPVPRTHLVATLGAYVPKNGDAFGIYFANKKRIAHVGMVHRWGEKFVDTVEGNTNEAGSREGDGVYHKRRLKKQIYAVSNWIDK